YSSVHSQLRIHPPFPPRRSSDLVVDVLVALARVGRGDGEAQLVELDDRLAELLPSGADGRGQHLAARDGPATDEPAGDLPGVVLDRKSTRLNSSHVKISYAVFCL